MFNTTITGSRRFAAQGWPIERLRAIGKASGATLNDVVLAMCSGAIRTYLIEHNALPDSGLVSMVPVGLNAKQSQSASGEGGNAVGAVMVKLGTDLDDPADRLAVDPRVDEDRQGGARLDDPAADHGDERPGDGPVDRHADAAAARHHPAAVQPDHQQRAGPASRCSTSTAPR